MLDTVKHKWLAKPIEDLCAGSRKKRRLLEEGKLLFCIGQTIEFEDSSSSLLGDEEACW